MLKVFHFVLDLKIYLIFSCVNPFLSNMRKRLSVTVRTCKITSINLDSVKTQVVLIPGAYNGKERSTPV